MRVDRKVGIVVAGHGSKIPEAISGFQALVALFIKEVVEYGFLEFERPGIEEAIDRVIARGAEVIVVLPAMLTAAHHVKTDIPKLIQNAQQKYPLIPIHYGRHLDLHPKILERCENRIQQALSDWKGININEMLLIVVGRGTSDSVANKDVITLTRLLKEAFRFGEARYCYTSVATPFFKDGLVEALSLPYRSILIFPYLLFRGILLNKIEEELRQFREDNPNYFVKLAQCLGPDPLVADALLDRFNEVIILENQEKTDNNEKDGKNTA
ncbi:MAG: sirohydrochlorin chelatase [Nitrospirae bacterium]|nr:sirohydrochlorin chelatase [Candidatus Troglogloeales bacterium]